MSRRPSYRIFRLQIASVLLFPIIFGGVGITQDETGLTGIPEFQSLNGEINEGNLNVHLSIPIFKRQGATVFSYNVHYDSNFWRVRTKRDGTKNWSAGTSGYGWPDAGRVYVTGIWNNWIVSGTGAACTVYGYAYHDTNNTVHPFPNVSIAPPGNTCVWPTSVTYNASDGSGYVATFDASNGAPTITLKDPSGRTITITDTLQSLTDLNGNNIKYDPLSGTATDTLGQAFTFATSTNSQYSYTGGNGAANVTINSASVTFATNFTCSGVSSQSGSISLPSSIVYPDGSQYSFMYDSAARLNRITLPTGAVIKYTYSNVGCDGTPNNLTKQVSLDGVHFDTWTFTRTGTPPSSSTTTITAPPVNGVANVTTVQFAYYQEILRKAYTGAATGTPLVQVTHCFNFSSAQPCSTATGPSSSQAGTPPLALSILRSYNGQSSDKTVMFYSGFIWPTEVDSYDFGATAPTRRIFTPTGTWNGSKCVAIGSNVVNRTCYINVNDSGSGVYSSTTFGYDGHGNLLSLGRNTGTQWLTTNYAYDTNGTVSKITDPNGTFTTFTSKVCGAAPVFAQTIQTYDSTGTVLPYPSDTLTYDCNSGKVLTVTDANKNKTTYTYNDPFWRITSSSDPLTGVSSSYTATTSETILNVGSSAVDTLTTVDGLGRVLTSQQRQGPASANFNTVSRSYDADGRLATVSMPCSTTAGATCGTIAKSYSYDGLNRITNIQNPGTTGYMSYAYTGQDVLQTVGPVASGASLKERQYEYDALGNLSSVCELTGGSGNGSCKQVANQTGYWTRYFYDPAGRLITISQNAQSAPQTRQFGYDEAGRITSEMNPESGTTKYTYDTVNSGGCQFGTGSNNGDLVLAVDANGNGNCYVHDGLHRLLSIGQAYSTSPNFSATNDSCFVYDAATVNGAGMQNAKGQTAEAFTIASNDPKGCGGTKITDEGLSYDAEGHLTDVFQSTPNSGSYYHTTAAYFANGAVNTLSGVPGQPTMTYTVDSMGRPQTAALGTTNLVSNTLYNTAQQVTEIDFSNTGDKDTFQYDANTGRMTQFKFSIGTQPYVLNGFLDWNPNGTLLAQNVSDNTTSQKQNCAYAYDDMARVSGANCGANTILNPDFESGNNNWQLGSGWSIVNNSNNAQSGNWYLSGSAASDSATFSLASNGTVWQSVTPGEVISYGGWVNRLSGTGYAWYSCEVVDANHNWVAWCNAAGIGDRTTLPGWAYYEQQFTIPANGAFVDFYAEIHGGGDSDTSLTSAYFDSTQFEGNGIWSQAFSYDAFGNLTKTGSYNWACPTCYDASTNRYTSKISSSISYDNDGNLLNDSLIAYTWNAYDQLVTLVDSSHNESFTYDAFGRLVERNNSGTIVQMLQTPVGPLGSVLSTGGVDLLYPLPGGGTFATGSSGQNDGIYHVDWLRSGRWFTSPSTRTVTGSRDYAPFGEPYVSSGNIVSEGRVNFAGDPSFLTNLLQDTPNRELRPIQGRWISPDPAGLAAVDMMNPQTLNRYAYVANTPLAAADATGLCMQTKDDAGDSCFGFDNFSFESFGSYFGFDPFGFGCVLNTFAFPCDSRMTRAFSILPGENSTNFPGPGLLTSVENLLGLSLPQSCGDFGACAPIGNGFNSSVLAIGGAAEGICVIAEPCGASALIFGGLFLGAVATADAYQYYRIPKPIRDAARAVGVSARALGDAVEQYKYDNGLPPNFNLDYATILTIAQALKRGEYFSK